MMMRKVVALLIALGIGLMLVQGALPHESTEWTWAGQKVLASDTCRTEYTNIDLNEPALWPGGVTEAPCEEVATKSTEQHGLSIGWLIVGLLLAGGALVGLCGAWASQRR